MTPLVQLERDEAEAPSDKTEAYWVALALRGGSREWTATRAALLGGMYAKREGEKSVDDNPFALDGGELWQNWHNGFVTTPRPLPSRVRSIGGQG
jgi:hypothetical protein